MSDDVNGIKILGCEANAAYFTGSYSWSANLSDGAALTSALHPVGPAVAGVVAPPLLGALPAFPPPGSRVETVNDAIVLAQSIIQALRGERDQALAGRDQLRRERNNILAEATRYVEERNEAQKSLAMIRGCRKDEAEELLDAKANWHWSAARVAMLHSYFRPGISQLPSEGGGHLIWWPDELSIPYFEGEIGARTVAPWSVKLTAEAGSHDYHGPLGTPDEKGDRHAVSDPAHEQFHRAVGDVLAGKIIPAARRQMQEALKATPKEVRSIPIGQSGDDPRRMGWKG